MPPPTRGLRILVADDHPVNQFLVRELIRMRGHQACVVSDGQAAVDRWSAEPFDVVLMDIQMPRLSGIDAARRIRELERDTGRATPIVALTANSGPGERELCLQAGINGFLTKPLDSNLLFPLIAQLTGGQIEAVVPAGATIPVNGAEPDIPPAETSPRPKGLLDREAALRLVRGNTKVLARLAALFRQQTPAVVECITNAIERRSAQDLSFHAHRLKGSLGFLALEPLEAAAQKLETRGKAGCWDDVPETWDEIRAALTTLDAELESLQT